MRFVLDTHILLWALTDEDRLTKSVRDTVQDGANEVLFSTVSIWEIAIKAASAKSGFTWNPSAILDEAIDAGFAELKITSAAAITGASLPLHHRDPFDRLLVGQAITEAARLITADVILKKYSELIDVM